MLGKWGILLMRQVVKLFVYCHGQHDLLTNQNSGILIHHGLFPVIKVHLLILVTFVELNLLLC